MIQQTFASLTRPCNVVVSIMSLGVVEVVGQVFLSNGLVSEPEKLLLETELAVGQMLVSEEAKRLCEDDILQETWSFVSQDALGSRSGLDFRLTLADSLLSDRRRRRLASNSDRSYFCGLGDRWCMLGAHGLRGSRGDGLRDCDRLRDDGFGNRRDGRGSRLEWFLYFRHPLMC